MATAVRPRARAESPPAEPEETLTSATLGAFAEDLSLAQKMLVITSQVGNIKKSKYNKAQDYWYATEVDILRALRPLLTKAGVFIQFSVVDCQVVPRDGRSLLTQVQLDYVVTDGTDTISGSCFGYGMDTGDKGVYKAITGAKKYALMLLFLIDTGDDPESDPAGDGSPPENNEYGDPNWPAGANERVPVVTQTTRTDLVRGGNTTTATDTQVDRLREACIANGVNTDMLRHTIAELLNVDVVDMPAYLREEISSRDIGRLILAVEAYGETAETGSPYG